MTGKKYDLSSISPAVVMSVAWLLGWAGLGWAGMQFSFLKLELSEERLGPGLGAGANLPPNFPLSSQTFHDTLAPDN